jgi:7-cyano-7-deazaguanine synthase
MDDGGALVLFSGGQDSTTCLAWALDRFARVETIGFDYGQRHRVELDVRPRVLERLRAGFPGWRDRLGEDHLIDLGVLGRISDTALTQGVAIAMQANGLPNTFVPGRNLLFMGFAGAVAYRRGLKHLVTGVCETDFSGYPDCRDDTMKAMQLALNLGMESRFVIHTPLMWIDKAATWAARGDRWAARRWSTSSGTRPTPATTATGSTATPGAMAVPPAPPATSGRRGGRGSGPARATSGQAGSPDRINLPAYQ